MDRRFAWFRRLLRDYESKFEQVFPAHWRVPYVRGPASASRAPLLTAPRPRSACCVDPATALLAQRLCIAFSEATRAHLVAVMSDIDPPESANVKALLAALRQARDFETEMRTKLEPPKPAPPAPAREESAEAAAAVERIEMDDEGNPLSPGTAASIRAKHKRLEAERKAREVRGRSMLRCGCC